MIEPIQPILHIPHSSILIPEDLRDTLLLSDAELSSEILRITDWYTDELFSLPPEDAMTVRFPVSRLIVDPERFLDDSLEPMAKKGLGAVYERSSIGTPLRNKPSSAERKELIERLYIPHHSALVSSTELSLSTSGFAFIVDCHSFPNTPLPFELDQNPDRPDICLGTDDFHTPPWLLEKAIESFQSSGLRVAVNRPFSGSITPQAYFRKDKRVVSLMIELNRSLYMNEMSGDKNSSFSAIQNHASVAILAMRDHIHAYLS